MKQTQISRNSTLKRGKRLNPVSSKQRLELAKRDNLRAYYRARCTGVCPTCEKLPDWRGFSLSHIIALSRGGKTTIENTTYECYPCHTMYEKRPELRPVNLPKQGLYKL